MIASMANVIPFLVPLVKILVTVELKDSVRSINVYFHVNIINNVNIHIIVCMASVVYHQIVLVRLKKTVVKMDLVFSTNVGMDVTIIKLAHIDSVALVKNTIRENALYCQELLVLIQKNVFLMAIVKKTNVHSHV